MQLINSIFYTINYNRSRLPPSHITFRYLFDFHHLFIQNSWSSKSNQQSNLKLLIFCQRNDFFLSSYCLFITHIQTRKAFILEIVVFTPFQTFLDINKEKKEIENFQAWANSIYQMPPNNKRVDQSGVYKKKNKKQTLHNHK